MYSKGDGIVIRWTVIPEYMALLLIFVIMLFFYDKRRVRTFRRSLYWVCLWLSAASIAVNLLCVYTIERTRELPIWINIALNSLYFWLSVLMCSAVAFYLFQRMLEYVYDKHCLRRAFTGLAIIMVLYTLLLLWNLSSGVVFWFDAQGNYQRGIYNRVGYLALLVEIVMLLICYVRNRKSVSADMRRVIRTIIPLVVAVGILQVTVFRSLLLNGTIIALADLVIFLGFQSRPIEQDSLTGLGSRKSFFEEVSLRTASGQGFQVVAVSLRDFGGITRKLGHRKGDDLLYQVGRYLTGVHPGCRAYRIRNMEFAVLVPWHNEQTQDELIEKILCRFRQNWYVEKEVCHLPFYGAVVSCRGEGWNAEQVIEQLEYTLQLAKNEGRDYIRFDREVGQMLQREKFLLETMRTALEERKFQVWYQPIFHREKGRFASAEALLRLTDPDGNPISPSEFIPLAEKKGLVDELTWVVLEQVCALLGSGAVPELEQVSINISMGQLLQRDLLERIQQMLDEYQVSPERVKLEITERMLLEDQAYIQETMERMKKHRLGFYLDDFGTGYANFSGVLDLPFEVIKLDRTLLAVHPDKPKAQDLPGVLIPFFHSLGHTIVAEGIETQEQARWMRQAGADRLQGYYYARPMQTEQLIELFQQQKNPVKT